MKNVWREQGDEEKRTTQLKFLKQVTIQVLNASGVCKERVDGFDIFDPSIKRGKDEQKLVKNKKSVLHHLHAGQTKISYTWVSVI